MVTPTLCIMNDTRTTLFPLIISSLFETDNACDTLESAHWYISTDSNFRFPVFLEITGCKNYNKLCPIMPLRYGVTYYVCVKYISTQKDIAVSDTLTFTLRKEYD